MILKRFLLFIFINTLLLGFLSAQSSWSVFRGNQQLSGSTSATIPEKPKLLSSFQTGDDIKASPVISGQTIFCGSTDGTMYAIGFDGKLKWKFDSGNAIEAPALLLEGSVVFGSLDGMFFRLDEKTGKQIWKYK
ncbi:MAG: PQQ-like beta-propeller repeat protein, partial [Prolixibacteraceae bacterium]|nr:PQQ-like beta-propeller repeat protein [Prolixibacteraceae bacterium]